MSFNHLITENIDPVLLVYDFHVLTNNHFLNVKSCTLCFHKGFLLFHVKIKCKMPQ